MDATDAPAQFMRLLTTQVSGKASELAASVSRCGELCVTGERHREILDHARCCAKELASLFLQSPFENEVEFFGLGLDALLACNAESMKSLFALHRISPHEPLEPQDASTWLACNAIFGGLPSAAPTVARALVKKRPQQVAAAGLIAAFVRTPFAVKMLSSCPLLVQAALECHEPFFGRNAAELLVDSTVGTSELFDAQIADAVMRWIQNPLGTPTGAQEWAVPMPPQSRQRAIQAVARSTSPHTFQWKRVESAAQAATESPLPACSLHQRAKAWAIVWRELRSTLDLTHSIFNRPNTVGTVMLCINTTQGLLAFARRVVLTQVTYDIWADACAHQIEEGARRSIAGLCGGEESPCFPNKAKFNKQSRLLMSLHASLQIPCMDARSTEVQAQTCSAFESQDWYEFCVASSAYRSLVSVTCCSFRSKV